MVRSIQDILEEVYEELLEVSRYNVDGCTHKDVTADIAIVRTEIRRILDDPEWDGGDWAA